MDMGKLFIGLFGDLKFYAALEKKLFAEISIEEDKIDIRIINGLVALQAMLVHMFKKHRVSSNKLLDLKKSGYTITIRYGKMKFNI
jgi:hypothetical protein